MTENKESAPVAGGAAARAGSGEWHGGLASALHHSLAREVDQVNDRDLFRRCREAVSAEEVARRYGVQIDRRGRALCIYHADHHPSMTFRDGRFRCWSCGASGNCIDYTVKLLGVDAMSAVRTLDADFHLGLPLDRPLSAEERAQATRREQIVDTRRRFEAWREETARDLSIAIRVANLAHKRGTGLTGDAERCAWWDTLAESEALAVREQARLEHWSDLLASKALADQMEVFRDREEVGRLCRTILRDSLMKSRTA